MWHLANIGERHRDVGICRDRKFVRVESDVEQSNRPAFEAGDGEPIGDASGEGEPSEMQPPWVRLPSSSPAARSRSVKPPWSAKLGEVTGGGTISVGEASGDVIGDGTTSVGEASGDITGDASGDSASVGSISGDSAAAGSVCLPRAGA